MKKSKLLTKLCAAVMLAVMVCMSFGVSSMAAKIDDSASTQNIAIVKTYNNLTLGTLGKLTCEGSTSVQSGYNAGIIVELQQYNGGWNTIKTWSGSSSTYVYVGKDWYVEKGYSYRLKLTHKAYNSSGTQIESFPKYSSTVSYR